MFVSGSDFFLNVGLRVNAKLSGDAALTCGRMSPTNWKSGDSINRRPRSQSGAAECFGEHLIPMQVNIASGSYSALAHRRRHDRPKCVKSGPGLEDQSRHRHISCENDRIIITDAACWRTLLFELPLGHAISGLVSHALTHRAAGSLLDRGAFDQVISAVLQTQISKTSQEYMRRNSAIASLISVFRRSSDVAPAV